MLPYIVSADVELLLTMWAARRGFTLPGPEFFHELRQALHQKLVAILPHCAVEIVGEQELTGGINRLVSVSGLAPLTLDRTYFPSQLRIDMCRWVDEQGNFIGEYPRSGSPRLPEQLRAIRESGVREVVLVDDVIFSGGIIVKLIPLLAQVGVTVKAVVAGIGISAGVTRIQALSIPVYCVRQYEEVADEVCERDFYPGVPFSGRTVRHPVADNLGAPYLLPYGKPVEWASIPEDRAQEFSDFCRGQTYRLFAEIGRLSGRGVRCCDLDRAVVGLPRDSTRFIDVV